MDLPTSILLAEVPIIALWIAIQGYCLNLRLKKLEQWQERYDKEHEDIKNGGL